LVAALEPDRENLSSTGRHPMDILIDDIHLRLMVTV